MKPSGLIFSWRSLLKASAVFPNLLLSVGWNVGLSGDFVPAPFSVTVPVPLLTPVPPPVTLIGPFSGRLPAPFSVPMSLNFLLSPFVTRNLGLSVDRFETEEEPMNRGRGSKETLN
jgi:hypothetical protein